MESEEAYYKCDKRLAARLQISYITLKRWIYSGKIRSVRTIAGRYRIPESEVMRLMGEPSTPPARRRAILYARVSGSDQVKDGDLDRQSAHLSEYASRRGYSVVESVKEVGSGLNDRRPKLFRILKSVRDRKADVIVVEYKDRLTRFGFNYLSEFVNSHGSTIETVFDDVRKDATQEMVEDMISIVQSFSARLYGRRSHKYQKVVGGVKHAVHA